MNIVINSCLSLILFLVERRDRDGLYSFIGIIERHITVEGVYYIISLCDKFLSVNDMEWLRKEIKRYMKKEKIIHIGVEDIKHLLEDEGMLTYSMHESYIEVEETSYKYLSDLIGREVLETIVKVKGL
jgi:hypothetical protein